SYVGEGGDGVGVVDRTGRDHPCDASCGAVEGGAAVAFGGAAYGVQVGGQELVGWEMPPPCRVVGLLCGVLVAGGGRQAVMRAGGSPPGLRWKCPIRR